MPAATCCCGPRQAYRQRESVGKCPDHYGLQLYLKFYLKLVNLMFLYSWKITNQSVIPQPLGFSPLPRGHHHTMTAAVFSELARA